MREIDVVESPLVPFLYPEREFRSRERRGIGRHAAGAKGPKVPEGDWSLVAARTMREGLRAVAREYGVSRETVRAVLRSATQADSVA